MLMTRRVRLVRIVKEFRPWLKYCGKNPRSVGGYWAPGAGNCMQTKLLVRVPSVCDLGLPTEPLKLQPKERACPGAEAGGVLCTAPRQAGIHLVRRWEVLAALPLTSNSTLGQNPPPALPRVLSHPPGWSRKPTGGISNKSACSGSCPAHHIVFFLLATALRLRRRTKEMLMLPRKKEANRGLYKLFSWLACHSQFLQGFFRPDGPLRDVTLFLNNAM